MMGRARRLRQTLLVALALFVGGTLAITGYMLWRLHAEAIANGLEMAAMHSRNFENMLTHTLNATELGATNAMPQDDEALDLRRIESNFVTTLRRAPFLRSMSLLDERGRIIASSNPANVGVTVATQSYLPPATGTPDILRIGQPWVGRDFASGRPSYTREPVDDEAATFIPVARTLAIGERTVTLLVALNPDFFLNQISQILGPVEGSVQVTRYDGTLLMDTNTKANIGSLDFYLVRDLRLSEVESGRFEQGGATDRPVLTAFMASRLYPLVVITHINREHALRNWQTVAKTVLGVVVLALLFISLLAVAFYRRQMLHTAQRVEAERLQRINATVFDASAESIIITDIHANIISVNAAFTRITGYGAAEVMGRNPRLLDSGRQDKSFYEKLWKDLLRDGVWQGELINRRKDGSLYDAHVTIATSRDGAGRVQHFIGDITDISERKQAQAVFHALFEQSSFLAGILDQQGRVVDINSTALQFIDVPRDEVIGRYFPDTPWWSDKLDREKLIEALGQAYSGTHAGFETTHTIASGGHINVMFNAMPIYLENGIRVAVVGVDISQRKRAEEALHDSEQRFRSFFDKNSSVMLLVEPSSGNLIDANAAAATFYGYPRERLIGMAVSNINTLPAERIAEERQLALLEKRNYFVFKHRLASGEVRDVEVYSTPIESGGRPLLFSLVHDISERKLAEEKVHLAASVFSHSREGIMITAADGTIIDVNDAFSRITGYQRSEVLGQNPRMLNSGRQSPEFYASMWRGLIDKGHWYGEVWNRRKNGEVFAEMQTISTVLDAHGQPQHYVSLFSDISAFKAHQKQLEHIAHFDALTSLPNRVLLADRMHQAIAQTQRRGQLLAVAYLDLDGFKSINDRHGHEAGDQLLVALASRMKQALREGDTLARIGGDEFVTVLLDLPDVAASMPMLNRLLAAAAQPVHFGELVLQVSASLGVTFYPQVEDADADLLLRQADQAMYQAKLAGKNRYHVFDAEQDRSVRGHHESVERIRSALAQGEFVLYYQPKVNMRTGTVIGVEALIRWQHPDKGLLAPAVFLPVIEDHPLAIAIGEWVIDTALTQMKLWQTNGLDIPVSVNIGARQLQQADFVQRLRTILASHPHIRPSALELEVLETSALEDLAHVSHVIEACREIGVMFALDDFGTGYSSLTYLKRLPVSLLKIDQSFVRGMLDDPDDLAILEGVIGLAGAFRRQVIAEGVETVAHGAMLLQLGCELAQGYGIAHPMPGHALPAWSAAWRTEPAWTDVPAVNREDFPLLFASAEHRAWVVAVTAFLKGEREAAPPGGLHQCRFGQWLDSEGRARYGAQPAFQAIEQLHRQAHVLMAAMLERQAHGHRAEALARLGELYALRDALLEQLKVLLQQHRAIDQVQPG